MSLADFLKQPHSRARDPVTPRTEIAAWETAIQRLVGRFEATLSRYQELRLTGWNVVREHRGIRYNAAALTIEFGTEGDETVITLEPDAIKPASGVLGRQPQLWRPAGAPRLLRGRRAMELSVGHPAR